MSSTYMYIYMHISTHTYTTIPQYPCRVAFRTHHIYPNPQMLKSPTYFHIMSVHPLHTLNKLQITYISYYIVNGCNQILYRIAQGIMTRKRLYMFSTDVIIVGLTIQHPPTTMYFFLNICSQLNPQVWNLKIWRAACIFNNQHDFWRLAYPIHLVEAMSYLKLNHI